MKKYILQVILFLVGCVPLLTAQEFPAKENNAFKNVFNPAATGRNDANAYLLGYLTRIVYVQYLNEDNNYRLSLTDTSRFRDKFIERTSHFFHKPILTKTTVNNQITPINNIGLNRDIKG
ncbi:MAG: hypothetical protein ACXWB9_08410, partial [Flavisolibacter sp.]